MIRFQLRALLMVVAAAVAICTGAHALHAAEPTRAASSESSEPTVAGEAAGGESHAGGHEPHLGAPKETGPLHEVKGDLAIWTAVVFLLLLAILGKFAWGPIIAGLQKREQAIADNISAAERTNEGAKLLLVEYERRLAGAAEQVRMMLDEARREAEQTKLDIIAEAKEGARLEAERGKRDVQLARDQALKELSERSTNMAVELAGKIIRAQLKPSDHSRLVQEAMTEFAKN